MIFRGNPVGVVPLVNGKRMVVGADFDGCAEAASDAHARRQDAIA